MDAKLPMNSPVPQPVPDFKDRSTGLLTFGILTIVLGGFAALFSFFTLVSIFVPMPADQPRTDAGAILMAAAVYVFLSAALIWMGIGSIKARRWARALLLIFSWGWLIVGVAAMAGAMVFMPAVLRNTPAPGNQPLPQGAEIFAMIVVCLFLGFFFILLPAIWAFFYSRRDVKATVEARNPDPCWTDACPLPVLAIVMWMLFSVVTFLFLPFSRHCVMPFFGTFLTGIAADAYCVLFAALWIYAAWLNYQLKPGGWWLLLIVFIVSMISVFWTFSLHDTIEMYQAGGYSQAELDRMEKLGPFLGKTGGILMGLANLPFIIYLLFVKRYFPKAS